MMRISKRKIQKYLGFTLLEVLVSIFLFAIMTMAIVSTMRQTTWLTGKLKVRTSSTLSVEIAMERLQRELQMAFNEKIQGDKTFFKVRETSGAQELTFSYLDSEIKTYISRRSPGLMVARYRLEREEGKETFKILRAEIPLFDADKLDQQKGHILAEGVLSFKLEFFDARNNAWKKEWDTARKDTTPNFPKAAKVEIETVDTNLPSTEWKDKALKLSTAFLILNELETQ